MVTILKKIKAWFKKTRVRLVMTYLGIIILAFLFISLYVTGSISNYMYNREEVELLANANIMANLVSDSIGADAQTIEESVKKVNVTATTRIIIVNNEAKVVYDSSKTGNNIAGKHFLKKEVMDALSGEDVVLNYKEKDLGTVVCSAVSVISDSQVVGAVYITDVATAADDFIDDIVWLLYVISIVVCILIGVLSAVMADVIVSPVEKLTKEISSADFKPGTEKIEFKGTVELESLANAFNSLTQNLDELEEKRRVFVSNASHELKTPLSSIKLLSESILSMEEVDTETTKEFMTDISGEVDRLNNIIERLLTLTKLDSETEKLNLKVTDVHEMVQRIVKNLTPVANNKGITVFMSTNEEVMAMVDREKLWQVIYNVTDNAIKYTPDGGKVEVGVYEEKENLRIEITDNGIGIPEKDLAKIFDRFYRVDKARSRESGGTGLGLSIVKELIEMHEGEINVESFEGSGTRVKIVLPRKLF